MNNKTFLIESNKELYIYENSGEDKYAKEKNYNLWPF